MQVFQLGRADLARTVIVSVVTLAAVAVLGLVLAYWTWVWFAPRAEPRAQPAAAQSGGAASANALFGKVPRNQNTAAPTGISIRLLGVVGPTGGRGRYPVVQLDGKQILAVHEDQDIAPGIRLAQVFADHVMLERGGVSETLAWPEKRAAAAPGAAAPATTAPNIK